MRKKTSAMVVRRRSLRTGSSLLCRPQLQQPAKEASNFSESSNVEDKIMFISNHEHWQQINLLVHMYQVERSAVGAVADKVERSKCNHNGVIKPNVSKNTFCYQAVWSAEWAVDKVGEICGVMHRCEETSSHVKILHAFPVFSLFSCLNFE